MAVKAATPPTYRTRSCIWLLTQDDDWAADQEVSRWCQQRTVLASDSWKVCRGSDASCLSVNSAVLVRLPQMQFTGLRSEIEKSRMTLIALSRSLWYLELRDSWPWHSRRKGLNGVEPVH